MVQANITRVVYLHPWTPSDVDPEMDEKKKAEYAKMEAKLSVKRLTLDDPDAAWAVTALRNSAKPVVDAKGDPKLHKATNGRQERLRPRHTR
jgi:hypothetical protein